MLSLSLSASAESRDDRFPDSSFTRLPFHAERPSALTGLIEQHLSSSLIAGAVLLFVQERGSHSVALHWGKDAAYGLRIARAAEGMRAAAARRPSMFLLRGEGGGCG